ncbi:META domain-containing protein [Bosea sp. UC22_33]|uniref:META domain-containing protein n=1 Tax=Bosea sp. UC22_33 TaxID=3350165 RepID=UPI0036704F73
MIRRLGLAAVLAALAVPMLMPGEAAAQRRGPAISAEERAGGGTPIPMPQQEKTFPLGASWSVVALNGKPVQDRRATLMIDQNLRGTGFGGCNTFSASAYPLRQQGLAVGPIALTKRSCDKGLLDFEKAFLIALRATNKWDIVNGRLVLKGGAGELTLSRSL